MPHSIRGFSLADKDERIENSKQNLLEISREHKKTKNVRNPPMFIRADFDETLSIWVARKLEKFVRRRARILTSSQKRGLMQDAPLALKEVVLGVIVNQIDPLVREVCSSPDPLYYVSSQKLSNSFHKEFKRLPGSSKNCSRVLVRELFPNPTCFSHKGKPLWRLQRQKERAINSAVLNGLRTVNWDRAVEHYLQIAENSKG